jgi:hypothetical protein
LSVLENVLVNLEGEVFREKQELMPGFSGKGDNDISVSIISQGSSEGIGLVVAADKANKRMIELKKNLKMISILGCQ